MGNMEASESVALRQLESLLLNKDGTRVLGNLYRTITGEGHVKWMCIDHVRENNHDKTADMSRKTVASPGGLLDENIGHVGVTLRSKLQAEQFYQVLGKAIPVYELKIDLDWDTTQHDFRKLCDTLATTKIGVLELDLGWYDGPVMDILNRSQRHDPILDIMRLSSNLLPSEGLGFSPIDPVYYLGTMSF